MSAPRATPSAQARGLEEGNGRAPAPTDEELRALLPAIEPERRLVDWGRSKRLEGAFDRTIGDFLYRLWFRCDTPTRSPTAVGYGHQRD